jgi:hypothetical protein
MYPGSAGKERPGGRLIAAIAQGTFVIAAFKAAEENAPRQGSRT